MLGIYSKNAKVYKLILTINYYSIQFEGFIFFQLENFLPVLKLIDILYTEREPLPVPDLNKPSCTYQVGILTIYYTYY